jgi:sterol desaturase/sphingolipid hydroxylase (fatty acid hydroxylase superfamily)
MTIEIDMHVINPKLFIFVAVITLVSFAETAWRYRQKRSVDIGDSANSAVIGIGYLFLKLLGAKALMLPVYLWLYDHRLVHIPLRSPVMWIGCWVGIDFVAYWTHRYEHKLRLLWASHLVHHSSQQYTMTTAVRMPWTEVFYKPFLAMWAPFVGFHPAVQATIGGLVLAIGQLQHTEMIGKLGVLDLFLMTPSNHRVHHASNKIYLDKNFGATSCVWDRVFGTYQAELAEVPVVYGITKPFKPRTPLATVSGGYLDLFTEVRSVPRGARRAYLFGSL